jgi:hypothetical protein
VGVLQDSGEVALAQALAIAAEQLAGGSADLAGANGSFSIGTDGAANEVECFFPAQA